MNKKELYPRKTTQAFIERLFRYYEYDFDHDSYKKMLIGEFTPNTNTLLKLKSFYDGYIYLLSNKASLLTKEVLKKFYYIIFGSELDDINALKLSTYYFKISTIPPLERAILFHLKAYEVLNLKEDDLNIIALMMLNYVLVKENIPSFRMTYNQIKLYKKLMKEEENLFIFLKDLINENKGFDKEYFKNLIPLSVKDIYHGINEDKEELIKKYKIKELMVYGSFAKGNELIDSDIDILLRLSDDLTYDEKVSNIEGLKTYLENKFKRLSDIHEIGMFISDDLIKQIKKIKIII